MKHFLIIVLSFFLSNLVIAGKKDTLAMYNLKARNKSIKGDYDSCLYYISKARNICSNYKDTILIYNFLGHTHYKLTDHYTAKLYLDSAIKVSESNNYIDFLPYIYHNLGLVYTDTKEFEKGLSFLQKSLIIMPISEKGAVLNDIGRCYRYNGNIDSSTYFLKRAFEFKIKQKGLNNYSTLLTALELYSNTHDEQILKEIGVFLLNSDNNYLKGHYYFTTQNYKEAEKCFKEDWFKLLMVYNASGQYFKAIEALDSLRNDYRDLESKLYRQANERFIYKSAIDQIIAKDTLQALKIALKSRGNMLRDEVGRTIKQFPPSYNYYDFDSVIYLFRIDKCIHFYKIKTDSVFNENLKQLKYCIQFDNAYNDYYRIYRHFCESSHFVFTKLVPKVNSEMNIIPDGRLQSIPFEALLTEMPIDTSMPDYKNLKYLFLETDIHYDYILSNHSPNTEKCNLTLLAPDGTLANSQRMAIELRKRYRGDIYKNRNATSKQIYKNKVLHIDAHYSPDVNFIKLADKRLYIDSINNLSKDLVVLSTCYSGMGRNYKGEGVFSPGRKFYEAGAKSVIESSWASDDESSYVILRGFYFYLSQGLNKSSALSNAKKDYLNNYPSYKLHPSFWSNFRVFGNNYPLKIKKKIKPKYTLLFLALIGIIVLFKYLLSFIRK